MTEFKKNVNNPSHNIFKARSKFVQDFASNMIDVKVFDVAGSNGLYTLVAKRGLYLKNAKGYDGTSSALGLVLTQ